MMEITFVGHIEIPTDNVKDAGSIAQAVQNFVGHTGVAVVSAAELERHAGLVDRMEERDPNA